MTLQSNPKLCVLGLLIIVLIVLERPCAVHSCLNWDFNY